MASSSASVSGAVRKISRVITAEQFVEGAGFRVRRPIGGRLVPDLNPFLMLDEFGPATDMAGAPNHPHRGFETVSYIKLGEFVHKDSMGNMGKLRSGDVQWMTAGSGIIHDEMPSDEHKASGKPMHGFQMWVNLPKKDKMCPPSYQDVPQSRIPVVELPNSLGQVKVIAGEHHGSKGAVTTRMPIQFIDFELNAGANVTHSVPANMAAAAYVYHGEVDFGTGAGVQRVKRGQMILFPEGGDAEAVPISVPMDRSKCDTDEQYTYKAGFLFMAAVPLREPVAKYGPFVMNTREEIAEAFADYQSGKLGSLPATFISRTGY